MRLPTKVSIRTEVSPQTAGTKTVPEQDAYGLKYEDITSKLQNQTKTLQEVNPLPDLQSTQGKVLTPPPPKKQGAVRGTHEPLISRKLQRHVVLHSQLGPAK